MNHKYLVCDPCEGVAMHRLMAAAVEQAGRKLSGSLGCFACLLSVNIQGCS